MRQLVFEIKTHGGARRGGGRKPKGARAGVAHVRRPALDHRHPVLVTLKVGRGVPHLRTQRMMVELRKAFARGRDRFGFRLVHFSVQRNHVHLIAEADGARPLSRGMQGLSIRLARGINRVAGRSGRVMADRYHARALGSPRQVRNALAYVLLNGRRHADPASLRGAPRLDPCSSAAAFDGWTDGSCAPHRDDGFEAVTEPARTWLLTVGWRRHGPIDPGERPGPTA